MTRFALLATLLAGFTLSACEVLEPEAEGAASTTVVPYTAPPPTASSGRRSGGGGGWGG